MGESDGQPHVLAETAPQSLLRPFGVAAPIALKVAIFCLIWSSAFSAAKIALPNCPPLLLLTIRFTLAGLVMLAAAALCGEAMRLTRKSILAFAVLGLFNNALYLGLSFVGLRTVSAGLTSIIVSANPVVTAVLAAVFLNERLTARKLLGLALGIGGVAYVVHNRLGRGFEDP